MMRIYRLLLYLYPASFRVEYGDQLWRDVSRRRRDVKGPVAAVGFWIAAIADIANNASRVQWDVLRQDLHYTRRLFRRAPAFALTAIAVSALGIGATTATFSMADHVLLRPLPFHEPDRLVRVWEDQSFRGYPQLEVSPANFRDWQHMSHSFASLAAYADSAVNMLGQGSPERLASANVTANLLDTLGVSPALGRSFTADDDRPGAAGTVILSHRLWQSHFGGDPRVVGRTIVLNDERFAVIGVMRADFEFPSRETTLWVPFRWVANDFDARDNFWIYPIARLRNGTTLEDARAEMKVIAAQLEHAYPKENERTSAGVYLLRDGVSDRARLLLMALAGGSLCILLIACINLASLLVARALSRQREFAVRCAIGAGRERLVRQMLTESVVLAGIGGMAGLALAAAAAPLIARLVPPTLPIAETPPLDARVLGIAFAATLLTGVGFGLVPALRMSRARMDALREGARSGTSRPTERLRSMLVVLQVTATVVLLMTSGLLLRALWRVQSTDPGFRVEDVQTFRTALPFPRYEQTTRRAAFYRRVLGEVRQLPGVSQAAYISFLPMTMRGGIWAVVPEGAPANENAGPTASLRFVTPGFFDTMRISSASWP